MAAMVAWKQFFCSNFVLFDCCAIWLTAQRWLQVRRRGSPVAPAFLGRCQNMVGAIGVATCQFTRFVQANVGDDQALAMLGEIVVHGHWRRAVATIFLFRDEFC